jgi:transcriptional regulator with XRE-family HTH domain
MSFDNSARSRLDKQTSLAQSIQMELARRGMSRKELVARSGLSASTVDKALTGTLSAATLVRIEEVLGRSFGATAADSAAAVAAAPPGRPAAENPMSELAPEYMGAYSRAAVRHYIGQYLTLRPAFSERDMVVAYATELFWNDQKPCLAFRERRKVDGHHEHIGSIYLPAAATYVYLVSLTTGAMRMVLVSQLGPKREMRGLITTLSNPIGSVYIPASAPIVYQRKESFEDCSFGHLRPGQKHYEEYRTILRRTIEDTHVRWGAP